MTTLEAAKALADKDPSTEAICAYCGSINWELQHKPDCPWLAMPQIVAALEALAEYADPDNWDHNEWAMPFKPELGLTGHGPTLAQRVLKPSSLPVQET